MLFFVYKQSIKFATEIKRKDSINFHVQTVNGDVLGNRATNRWANHGIFCSKVCINAVRLITIRTKYHDVSLFCFVEFSSLAGRWFSVLNE